jgi:hypothetical protein
MTSTDSNIINQTKQPESEHLSKGAKAGIGAGLALFFILVLGALVAVILLKRRRSTTARKLDNSRFEKPELDGKGKELDLPSELEAHQRSELEGTTPRYELDGQRHT